MYILSTRSKYRATQFQFPTHHIPSSSGIEAFIVYPQSTPYLCSSRVDIRHNKYYYTEIADLYVEAGKEKGHGSFSVHSEQPDQGKTDIS